MRRGQYRPSFFYDFLLIIFYLLYTFVIYVFDVWGEHASEAFMLFISVCVCVCVLYAYIRNSKNGPYPPNLYISFVA